MYYLVQVAVWNSAHLSLIQTLIYLWTPLLLLLLLLTLILPCSSLEIVLLHETRKT